MAVPGEDQRDWDFAKAYDLPIIRTVQPPSDFDGEAYTEDGAKINSAWLDGLDMADAKRTAIEWLETQGIGRRTINYRLRDWLLSRQRYWGCPIPVLYCEKDGMVPVPEDQLPIVLPGDGMVPVPEDQLPIVLPDDVEFRPTGESPLQFHEGFLNTTCPTCGGPATRNRHHGHLVDSSFTSSLLRPVEPRIAFTQKPPTVDAATSTSAHEQAILTDVARFYTKASPTSHCPRTSARPSAPLTKA